MSKDEKVAKLKKLMGSTLGMIELSLSASSTPAQRTEFQHIAYTSALKASRLIDEIFSEKVPAKDVFKGTEEEVLAWVMDEISQETGKGASKLPREAPKRIMYIDDNPVTQQIAERILAQRGHTVTSVGNAAQAVATLRNEYFELMLIDLDLPHFDAGDLIRTIRKHESSRGGGLPIIGISASAAEDLPDPAIGLMVDRFLRRPFDSSKLIRMVSGLK